MAEQGGEPPEAGIDPTAFRPEAGERKGLSAESEKSLRRLRQARRESGHLSPRAYNLTISHKYRFVWFRNAKVGTRTISRFLEEHDPDAQLLVLSRTPYPTAAFADYFKFGFARHPLERFISAWEDKVGRQNHFGFDPDELKRMKAIENFAAWTAEQDLTAPRIDRHIALQSRLIDLSQIDFVGRLETFRDDFRLVCETVGMTWAEPKALNQSVNRETDHEGVPTKVRSILEEKYRLDYQVFGY